MTNIKSKIQKLVSPEERRFLIRPMVNDWLQWSQEFAEQQDDRPYMPQVTLSLIAEQKSYIEKLESLVLELGEVAEVAGWYRENSEPTFFELAGGDGAPSGHLPYQGNWDKLNEALAKLTDKLGSM